MIITSDAVPKIACGREIRNNYTTSRGLIMRCNFGLFGNINVIVKFADVMHEQRLAPHDDSSIIVQTARCFRNDNSKNGDIQVEIE